MHAIKTEWVSIDVSDGTKMEAYVARPEGGDPRPGLLVFQEIFGVNPHIRDVTERFAREGYVAIAPDIFHRLAPRYEAGYEDIQPSRAIAMKLAPADMMIDLTSSFSHLSAMAGVKKDRIGAIGYCLGGSLAYAAGALAPLACAVSYYGGRIDSQLDLVERLSGPILFFWAGKDAYITAEAHKKVADTLRAAGKPFVDVEMSWADHGFFCDARSNYDAGATALAWPLTLAFLAEHLGRG